MILDRSFWSVRHWEKFHANMFICETLEGECSRSSQQPPATCRSSQGQRSYRELPIRFTEFEACTATSPAACTGCVPGVVGPDDGTLRTTPGRSPRRIDRHI